MMDGLPCGKTRKVLLNECNQPIAVVYAPKNKRTVLVANKEGVIERMKTSFRKELVRSMEFVSELEMFDDSIYMLDSSILSGNDKVYSVSVWAWPNPKIKVRIIGIHNVKSLLDKLACDLGASSALFEVGYGDELMQVRIINGKAVFL